MYGSKLITIATVGLVAGSAAGFTYLGYSLANNKAKAEIAQLEQAHEQAQRQAIEAAVQQERSHHERVAQATRNAAQRSQSASVGFAAANDELRLLNDAALAYARDAESAAAAHQLRADLFYDLFGRCAAEYLSMAQKADRADNAARTLIEAWPR